jgi:hypothetical protein
VINRIWFCVGQVFLWFVAARAGETTRAQLDAWLDSSVRIWRWHLGEATGAERPGFDDADWELVDLGFKWWPHDSTGWFRTRITVPETINGIPVRGGVVRLRVGIDNAARAYVNGVFKQEFEWSKGDFILTEKARPGDVITVALQAFNRPGSGSLYEAWLVNGPGEILVDALRDLARDCGAALEDAEYVPATEAAHMRTLVHAALQALDLQSYQTCNRDAFLASVAKARAILLSDRATVEERLNQTAANLATLKQRIRQGREAGRFPAYQAVDARVVESFLRYVRDDLAEDQPGHQLRGLKGAAYLDWLCSSALAANADADLAVDVAVAVPQYQTGPCAIRAGAFWQHGRPVYFTGVGHFGQVRQDIPILTDYGLNIIQIEMGPANGLPTPDRVDGEAIRENVVRWLDQAAAHNVAVNLLISPHYFPTWAFAADPAHRQCGHGFLKFCLEAPNTRVVMEKWLDALMPLIARHPALHSICLSNEPQYQGRCAYERARFQAWLKAKWGSLRQVNRAYGTRFRHFGDIDLPSAASPYGLCFDRWRFNQDRLVAFHEMLRDRIHRYDPALPVHAKVMSHAFEDSGRFEVGIDHERFTQLDRIAGNDCGMAFAGARRGEYACDWQTMAMNYTLQHSVAPDRPIFNSENHLIGDGDTRYLPEAYIRTVYWLEALHGQGATTTWVWERGQSGDLAENILTRANCVRALGRVALDLQRLASEVHALSQAPAELAILYSYSSLWPSKDYVDEAQAAFEGAYFAGAAADFVTERQIESGKLSQYKIVVLPRASHAPAATVKGLNQFLRNGGTVMTVGSCLTRDEYGRRRQQTLVATGRGRLVAYPDPLTARAYREILDRLLDEARVMRPVRIEGSQGERIWGVNVRAVETDGRILANVLNLSRIAQRVRFVATPGTRHVLNLMDGKPLELPFTLRPLEPMLLATPLGSHLDI